MRQHTRIVCVFIGLTLIAFGLFFTLSIPSLSALTDSNPDRPLRAGTEGNLLSVGLASILAGAALCIASLAWMAGAGSNWRHRVEMDYAAFPAEAAPMGREHGAFLALWWVITSLVLLALVQSLFWSHRYSGRDVGWYDILTLESGIFETLTAVALLIAGVIFIVAARETRIQQGPGLRLWPPRLLGLLLIIGAGEEISWGQHWLQFPTPAALESINQQREFNLHNISSHWSNHLMVLFFLTYVGILPLLARFSRLTRYIIDRLNIPLCPLVFFPFALIGVSMSEAFPGVWGHPLWSPNEARETLFGMVMLGVSIHFYLSCRVSRTDNSQFRASR